MGGMARRDDGFSMVEVLFAAFLAFFVLTALFSVLVTSSSQGRIASMDTIATDLAQLVVEQARALPYDSVGTTGTGMGPSEVVGSMKASEDTTFQGIPFHIAREVVWVDDPMGSGGTAPGDYKRLTVRVSWKGGHTTPIVTYIRDRTNTTPEPPIVDLIAYPTPNSILYSDTFNITYALDPLTGAIQQWPSVQASASVVSTGGVITRMEIRINGVTVEDTVSQPDTATVEQFPSSPWVIDMHKPDQPPFHEGLNTIEVYATSSNMGYAYRTLVLMVDDEAPEFSSDATFTLSAPSVNRDKYNSKLDMLCTPAFDGTEPMKRYGTAVWWPDSSGIPQRHDYGTYDYKNTVVTSTLTTGTPTGFAPTPFTPYAVELTPLSIRNLAGPSLTSSRSCSPPQLRGRIYGYRPAGQMAYKFKLDISAPNPSADVVQAWFGTTSMQYVVYTRSAVGYTYPGYGNLEGATARAPIAPTTYTDFDTGGEWNFYVQLCVELGNGQKLWSNVIGPVPSKPNNLQTLPIAVP